MCMSRALVRRMIKQNYLAAGVQETDHKKISSPLGWHFFCFSGVEEERRTPPASSRLLDHGPTWYPQDRHNIMRVLALPATRRVGRGLSLCRDRRSIVAQIDFYQSVNKLQRTQIMCSACSRAKKSEGSQTSFPLFPRSGGTRISQAVSWKQYFFKYSSFDTWDVIVFPLPLV